MSPLAKEEQASSPTRPLAGDSELASESVGALSRWKWIYANADCGLDDSCIIGALSFFNVLPVSVQLDTDSANFTYKGIDCSSELILDVVRNFKEEGIEYVPVYVDDDDDEVITGTGVYAKKIISAGGEVVVPSHCQYVIFYSPFELQDGATIILNSGSDLMVLE
jgi:hypothetical protein